MPKTSKPKVSKKALDAAVEEMESLTRELKKKGDRLSELRHKMAELFHEGEHGTCTFELHDYEIKTVRKMSITCPKEAAEQLADDDEKLYEKLFPKKISRTLNQAVAKANLDQLDQYLTTKQGLPVITIKRL